MRTPSGNGKTRLASAAAALSGVRFFNAAVSTLTSKWRGDSEKLLRTLFTLARRGPTPAVIFIDEVDALAGSRDAEGEHEASRRFKSELLAQMDGLASTSAAASGNAAPVIVLAATNRPWDLDEAMRRRFEKRIYVPLPDAAARKQLFDRQLGSLPLAEDMDVGSLVSATEGYSGADIKLISRDAAMMPLRRLTAGRSPAEIRALQDSGELEASAISAADAQEALKRVARSVAPGEVQRYEQWAAEFAST